MPPKTDWNLKFFRDVLGLECLHFGYFEDTAAAPTLETLRVAQERYVGKLVELFPAGAHSVLDVGAGTGEVARMLAAKGYAVQSVSPDAYQREVFTRKNPGIPFHASTFEDLAIGGSFDVILMSESCQYLRLDRTFQQCRRLLARGGAVVVSDYFRIYRMRYYRTTHVWEDFVAAARRGGFRILQDVDVTANVLPTLRLGAQLYRRYALPAIEVLAGYASDRMPQIAWLVRVLFGRALRKVRFYLYEHTRDKLDETLFAQRMRYRFLSLIVDA
jgi:SAM-dependent methyltransferase